MNKFVRIIRDGEYTDYTPQDLIHNDVNKFSGWKCSAGSEGLFIDWDGSVWPATCEVGRKNYYLGSLKDEHPIKLLNEYIDCYHNYCPCLVEIYLPKYKSSKNELNEIKEGAVDLSDFSAVTRASKFDRDRKYIMWAFGRKCNFSCSYCDDNSHSKLDSDLVELAAVTKALEYAERFREGKPLMWSFTGGEPTINPLFLGLVKNLSNKGDVITVATNGSAPSEYYAELAKYANINISVHFEFLKPEKLRRITESIISSQPHWFGLNFMIMPGKAELTYSYASILSDIPKFKETATVHFDILRKKNTGIYEIYSEQDMQIINKLKLGEY
jgi:MoaA/NifB/PqqE/SkfB family radical SAM enzyme